MRQFTDQSGLYYLNARYCDAGIRHTDQSSRCMERSDMIRYAFMALRGPT
jgi:hypothetical protein